MFELRQILEGYYTFGEILLFFVRLWIITLLIVLVAAVMKYHDFIFSAVGDYMVNMLDAIGPIIVILIGLHILFRSVFR